MEDFYSGSGLGFLLGSFASRGIITGGSSGFCVCPNL